MPGPAIWQVPPDGVPPAAHAAALRTWLTEFAEHRPGLPLVITENGYPRRRGGPHPLRDPERIEFLEAHLRQVLAARQAEVPIEGYFAWSFLDSIEWDSLGDVEFGLIAVEGGTRARHPRQSAHWYRDRIAAERLGGEP